MRLLPALLFCCLTFSIFGQVPFEIERVHPTVRLSGEAPALANPWAGGLNNPQPSAADLNGDGEQDLYIFDRKGDKHLAFTRNEQGGFVYAPELTANFPSQIEHWVLLRDFDDDGIMDLFAHSDTLVSGILVYKGRRTPAGLLAFDRLSWGDQLPLLYFPQSNGARTQIFVSTIDYPSISDIDCDGDLDILTFNVGGGFVEFYQNQSIEQGYGRDSLIFELIDDCYGGVYESGLSPEVTLFGNPDGCATPFQNPDEEGEVAGGRHAGSTLLTFDNNQDGYLELALGDVSFTEIVLLENAGDCEDAWFNDQELNYPQADVPVDIVFFPASFYLDIDLDGVRDFVAAPNQLNNAEDYNVFWYYHNDGQDDLPTPVLRDSQMLTRDMIDLGTGAIPVPFDVNRDGRIDLVVGNYNNFNNNLTVIDSRLHVFLNVGTPGEPVFRLTQTDYLNMSEVLSTTNEFAPAFGDLNGDNQPDALVGGQNGKLFFYANQATGDDAPVFTNFVYPFQDIDVGQSARPNIVDLDRDGLNDLVIGSRDGRIHYYRNIGTANTPAFEADPTMGDNAIQLGGIDTRNLGSSVGYASPTLIDQGNDFLLITGTRRGQLEVYNNIDNNLAGTFNLIDGRLGGIDPGTRSELCLADFDGDNFLELVVGNERGGLSYFSTNIEASGEVISDITEATVDELSLFVHPNPTSGLALLSGLPQHEQLANITLYAANGAQVFSRQLDVINQQVELDLSGLPSGLYWLNYRDTQQTKTLKIILR